MWFPSFISSFVLRKYPDPEQSSVVPPNRGFYLSKNRGVAPDSCHLDQGTIYIPIFSIYSSIGDRKLRNLRTTDENENKTG